jgi:hypothetical protein
VHVYIADLMSTGAPTRRIAAANRDWGEAVFDMFDRDPERRLGFAASLRPRNSVTCEVAGSQLCPRSPRTNSAKAAPISGPLDS